MTTQSLGDLSRPLPSPVGSVIALTLDDGAVLFDGRTETYFGLNPVGMEIWGLLPPVHGTLGALCEILRQKYPEVSIEQLTADVSALLDELTEQGLVDPASAV